MTKSTDPPIEITPTAEHAAELAKLSHLSQKIRYAAEHGPAPQTAVVRAWLDAHGVNTEDRRSYVSNIVSTWRKVRGIDDTSEQQTLTSEMMAELEAAAAEPDPAVLNADPEPAPIPVLNAPEPRASVSTEIRTPADEGSGQESEKARGTGPFYAVALLASLLSLDTSVRFFATKLGITETYEQWILCGIAEVTLVACGYAIRHNVRRPGGKAGPAQLVAFALCGVTAFMAVSIGGPVAGTVRALLGPVLALAALHLALGIEVRVRPGGAKTGTLARVRAELRERLLSRLGLGDDQRDALSRSRDRAADRAARLASSRWTIARKQRLARAVRISNAALDPRQRERVKTQVAAQRNLSDLMTLDAPSPWR